MQKRKHHKVGSESLYYKPEVDAPWPYNEFFKRLGLVVLDTISILSWGIPIIILDILYGSGKESTWQICSGFVYIFVMSIISTALILSANPTAVPITAFKKIFTCSFPPLVILYHLPKAIIKRLFRLLKIFIPTGRRFLWRFGMTILILTGGICLEAIVYLVWMFIPFNIEWLDKIVIAEIILLVPSAYIINRLLDKRCATGKDVHNITLLLDVFYNCLHPVMVLYFKLVRPVIVITYRIIFRNKNEPNWLW